MVEFESIMKLFVVTAAFLGIALVCAPQQVLSGLFAPVPLTATRYPHFDLARLNATRLHMRRAKKQAPRAG